MKETCCGSYTDCEYCGLQSDTKDTWISFTTTLLLFYLSQSPPSYVLGRRKNFWLRLYLIDLDWTQKRWRPKRRQKEFYTSMLILKGKVKTREPQSTEEKKIEIICFKVCFTCTRWRYWGEHWRVWCLHSISVSCILRP